MYFGELLTAMVTPMDGGGKINLDQVAALAHKLVEEGSDGLVIAGTTGESPSLSHHEKLELFKVVKGAIGNSAKVIAGTGFNVTAASMELTREAEELGMDGIMLVVPYYNKPSQEGLYQHFAQVAQATALPVMLYNVPGRTGQNLAPETVARLAGIANIVAIKEAAGNMDQASLIRRLTPPGFDLYSGDDSLTLPMLALGAQGVVSVASHLVGKPMKEMITAFKSGEVKRALELHLRLLPIFKTLFITTNPVPVKAALNLSGFKAGALRLPLVEATPSEVETIKGAMIEVGLLF